MKQHPVHIDIVNLDGVALYPPRRKFWDWLPIFVREFLLGRGYSPPPTPREVWVVESAALRAAYRKIMHAAFDGASAQNVAGHIISPGSSELN